MNLNAPDFLKDLEGIQNKLDGSLSIDELTNATNLPELSEFSELAKGLLPENLIKADENGKLGLVSLTELQNALFNGLTDIKGYLENEIVGVFNSLKGEVENVYNQAKTVYDDIKNLSANIQNDSSVIADLAVSSLNSATGLNIEVQDLANLQKTVSNTIESFAQLSPKKVKDLADPNFYGRVVNATLNTTLDLTGKTAELIATQSLINDQLDSSGYVDMFKSAIESGKNLLPKENPDDPSKEKVTVYRTVYWGKGEGALPEAAAQKANSGNKLVDDYSLAVDNSKVIIGSKVKFADDKKEREAVDVATPSKGITTSGENPTVAIYFETKEKAQAYLKSHPERNVLATVTVPSPKEKENKQKLKKKAAETKTTISKEESQKMLEDIRRENAETEDVIKKLEAKLKQAKQS